MRGHLASAAGWVGGRAHGLEHLLGDSIAKREAEGAIAVVGEEPVVAGAHGHASGDQQGFVPGTGDLEEDLLLPLQHNFAVVGATGEVHEPVELNHLLPRQEARLKLPTTHRWLRFLLRHS